MKKLILPLILLTSLSAYPQKQSCKCRPPQPPPSYDDDPDEDYTYKRMYGQVSSTKPEPIENMTIEVYDYLEPAGSSSSKSRITQRLIASCKTDKHGMFCFRRIPPGKYEIRISDRESYRPAGPWEDVSFVVTIDPRKRGSDKLIKAFLQFRI